MSYVADFMLPGIVGGGEVDDGVESDEHRCIHVPEVHANRRNVRNFVAERAPLVQVRVQSNDLVPGPLKKRHHH
jgi:hypothetical protein